MGIFGGDEGGNDTANLLAEQQYNAHQAEIEQRKKSLFTERLQLVKSLGEQQWNVGLTTLNPPQNKPPLSG